MTAPAMQGLDPFGVSLRGTHLIEASAGTGKTYTIATLYLRLLLERRLHVREVLVVTFTEAATAELRGRIRERLAEAVAALGNFQQGREDPHLTEDPVLAHLVEWAQKRGQVESGRRHLLAALRSFDEATISTIHAFCLRVLQDNAFASQASFNPTFVTDSRSLYLQVAQDFWAQRTYRASPALVRHLQQQGITPARLATLVQKVAQSPGIEILPQAQPTELAPFEERFLAAHARAAALWQSQGQAIIDLLATYPGLNRNRYRASSIRGRWRRDLHEVMSAPLPYLEARCKSFARFTPDGLRQGLKSGGSPLVHPFFDACAELSRADAELQSALQVQVLQLLVELGQSAQRLLQERKESLNVHTYDDLLTRVAAALRGEGGAALAAWIRQRFPAALIDEFQDTDALQYEIFQRTYGEQNTDTALYLIGDPKQAIYGFRGADIFAYLQAKRSAGAGVTTLHVNWRSDPSLLRALNALFGGVPTPFVYKEITAVPATPREGATDRLAGAGAAFRLLKVDGAPEPGSPKQRTMSWALEHMLPKVAADIAALVGGPARIDGQPVQPGHVAVLTRTNHQALAMQEALRRQGLPAVLQGEASVFEEPEAVELERILTALAHPGDARALRAAITTTPLGVTGEELDAMQTNDAAWDAWVERVAGWHHIWVRQGFIQAFRRLLDDQEVRGRLLSYVDGERRLTNLLHLGELLQQVASERRWGPEALLSWLSRMRREPAARAELGEDAARLRLESDDDAVTLVTIHKSKGLEYPIVYCPFLWDGRLLHREEEAWVRFHAPADDPNPGALRLDLGSERREQHLALAEREAMAENLRLLYVALTRARHQVNVVWGRLSRAETSPLGYLLHAPDVHQGGECTVFDANDPVERAKLRLQGLDDAGVEQDIRRWIGTTGGAAELVELMEVSAPPASLEPSGQPASLRPRPRRRKSYSVHRLSSFTRMIAEPSGGPGLSWAAAEGRDVDPVGPAAEPQGLLEAAAGPAQAQAALPLSMLAPGAATGLLVHQLLEELDFTQVSGPVEDTVARTLVQHGVDVRHGAGVVSDLRQILTTPLGGWEAGAPAGLDAGAGAGAGASASASASASAGASAGAASSAVESFCLADIPPQDRINEMEFLFPVHDPDHGWGGVETYGEELVGMRATSLARVLGTAGPNDPLLRAYRRQVSQLGFPPLAGFLKGYIDLVFRRDGRWYVVDYKTNHLGDAPHHYNQASLRAAMAEHHYVLQLYLYCLAVHRYLQLRVPGYTYEEHFGGAYYLFLRGMGTGPGQGVLFHRPEPSTLRQLNQLVTGPRRAA